MGEWPFSRPMVSQPVPGPLCWALSTTPRRLLPSRPRSHKLRTHQPEWVSNPPASRTVQGFPWILSPSTLPQDHIILACHSSCNWAFPPAPGQTTPARTGGWSFCPVVSSLLSQHQHHCCAPPPDSRRITLLWYSPHQPTSRWVTHLAAELLPNPHCHLIISRASHSPQLWQTPQTQVQSTSAGSTFPAALSEARLVLDNPEEDIVFTGGQARSSDPGGLWLYQRPE